MSDCIFCKIIARELPCNMIHEDDHVVIFTDINPKAKVHWLCVPKVHLNNLYDVSSEHQTLMSHMMCQLPKIATEKGIDSFRAIINNGENSGQEVGHLHMHLLSGEGRLPGF